MYECRLNKSTGAGKMKHENKEKVLMCCSELSVKGGMVSVVKNYLNYPDWDNYEIVYIPTHTEKIKLLLLHILRLHI